MVTVAGVVLAAGSGTRMGGPKAELILAGERLLDRGIRVMGAGGCAPLFAVVRTGTSVTGATPIVNHAPERGMRSSLELAVAACGEVDTIAVLLMDLPGVDAAAVRAVVRAWQPGRIAVGAYRGSGSGYPIVMSPTAWSQAIAIADADEGARAYLRNNRELVDAVAVPGSLGDLDTPQDVEDWTG